MEQSFENLSDFENYNEQSEQITSNASKNSLESYDEKVFVKNLNLSIRLKELEVDNNLLRAEVQKLYSLLRENAAQQQDANYEFESAGMLELQKKSEQEENSSLTAINVHLTQLASHINAVNERRITIEQRLPGLSQKYEQTFSKLLQKYELFCKHEKWNKEKEALKEYFSNVCDQMKHQVNEVSNVCGIISEKQTEMTTDKLKIFEYMDSFKYKLETTLKATEEKYGKLCTVIENKETAEQYAIKLQENKELAEKWKKSQENEKLLQSNIDNLQEKLQNLETEKNKLQSEFNEISEEKTMLTNEKTYEARRANKFEHMTVETNSKYKEEIKNNAQLSEEIKLLQTRNAEFQEEIKKLQEKNLLQENKLLHEDQNLENPYNYNSRTNHWDASDNVSLATSFSSITFTHETQLTETVPVNPNTVNPSTGPVTKKMRYCGHQAKIPHSQLKKQRVPLWKMPRPAPKGDSSIESSFTLDSPN